MLLNMGEIDGKRVMQEGTVRYFTSGDMQEPYKEFKHWKGMNGCAYANLLRVMKEPGKAITFASEGEYSGDGWLGPCLINDSKHKISLVHMLQRVDSNTSSYMRRIRNVVGAAVSE